MTRVTFDTNAVPVKEHEKKLFSEKTQGLGIEVAVVTVTKREMDGYPLSATIENILQETAVFEESSWDSSTWGSNQIQESFVLGESHLGSGKLGSSTSRTDLEDLLKLISNGSFPKIGARQNLNDGHRRILRDAMILEAHLRDGRDILVSNDAKAFGKKGSNLRTTIESRYKTKIMSLEEFYESLN